MTDFKALAAHPAAFDKEIARLYADVAETERAMGAVMERAHSEAGDRRRFTEHSRKHTWGLSAGEALAKAPEAARLYDTYHEDHVRLTSAITDAGREYAGWSRFFPTETNSGGHIHSNLNCRTLYSTTDIRWRPDLSGKTVDQAVAELGPVLCQVCFPEAKAEYKRDPREYARERTAERKAAEKAEKAAKAAPKKLAEDEQFTSSYSGDHVTTVAACKQLVRDAAEQRVELEWYRTPAAATSWAGSEEQLAVVARNVAANLAQMDDDAAQAEAVLLRREGQHEGYGATAEAISQIKDRADKKARKAWGI